MDGNGNMHVKARAVSLTSLKYNINGNGIISVLNGKVYCAMQRAPENKGITCLGAVLRQLNQK